MSPQADRSPAFQFYARDFLSDVRVMAMSLEEVGAYWKLVSICWLEEGLPSDLTVLARLLHVTPSKLKKLWPAIEPCFRLEDGLYQHNRLDREREKQDEYRRKQSEKGKKSAEARFNHGSTTVQPEGDRTPTGRQPEGNSSSSSSSASSSASASAVSFGQRRGAGAMGGSYLSQSTAAYIGARGVVIPPGKFYTEMLAKFDGDPMTFASWLDEVIARQPSGWKCGDVFRWVREQIDAQFNVKQGTAKTAGNVAAIQAFVRGGQR